MTNYSRRLFLGSAAAVSAGFLGLRRFAMADLDEEALAGDGDGYGPILPDPDEVLSLPKGFSYKIISRLGDRMDDGFFVPGNPDGMACFSAADGLTVLVRNHENSENNDMSVGPFGEQNELLSRVDRKRIYDAGRWQNPPLGGTTTIVYDTQNQRIARQFLSLAGTRTNCNGGPTPWGTWITCEETCERAGDVLEKDHGYNFEVPATVDVGLIQPRPIRAMGRFRHESISVDPTTGIVYQTEDLDDGVFYRYIPRVPGRLLQGGRLQALVVRGRPKLDTSNAAGQSVAPGSVMDVDWIDMDNVEAPNNDLRFRAWERGAARFRRGEGTWFGRKSVYFTCTTGGASSLGQVWRYVPSPLEGREGENEDPGRLELFIEPNDPRKLVHADNLRFAPWGDVLICEEGGVPNRIIGVRPDGKFYALMHNHRVRRNGLPSDESCGMCFSADGTTMFINMQQEGLTAAITGPWRHV